MVQLNEKQRQAQSQSTAPMEVLEGAGESIYTVKKIGGWVVAIVTFAVLWNTFLTEQPSTTDFEAQSTEQLEARFGKNFANAPKEAMQYLQNAEKAKLAFSSFHLGRIYERGMAGQPTNQERANYHYWKAYAKGYEPAFSALRVNGGADSYLQLRQRLNGGDPALENQIETHDVMGAFQLNLEFSSPTEELTYLNSFDYQTRSFIITKLNYEMMSQRLSRAQN